MRIAYLDIETYYVGKKIGDAQFTDFKNQMPTVIGILTVENLSPEREDFIQLIVKDVDEVEVKKNLNMIEERCFIVGYNILRFDIPILHAHFGFNPRVMSVEDLMFKCWERNLKGGMKKVCEQLGIERPNKTMGTGDTAMVLWDMYQKNGDEEALKRLLKYNEDDVRTLKMLREVLYG